MKVTKKEFYRRLMELNYSVHPYPRGKYPYTTEFKTQLGFVWGKQVPAADVYDAYLAGELDRIDEVGKEYYYYIREY